MNSNGVPKIFKITLANEHGEISTYILDGVVDNEWYDIINTYQQNIQSKFKEEYSWLIIELINFFIGRSKLSPPTPTLDTITDLEYEIAEGETLAPEQYKFIKIYNKYNKPEYFGWWKNGATFQNGFIYTTDSVYHIYLDIDSY